MPLRLLPLLPVAGLLLVLAPGGAGAVTINYNPCTGITVEYTGISESSSDAPLYNQPVCNGDLLDFDPTGFEANSSSGSNPDLVDGNVLFTISALDSFVIDNLILEEGGDWEVFGIEPSNSQANVTLTVRLEILIAASAGGFLEVEYARRTPQPHTTASFDGLEEPWSIQEQFLMASILADACNGTGFFHPVTGGPTGTGGTGPIPDACGATTAEVGVNVDNTLLAFAQSGELAYINKKDFDGFTITTETEPVPEPATGALLALGLAAIAARRRR